MPTSNQTPVRDMRATVRRLYRGLDGYRVPEAEKRRVRQARSSPTYGELMPTATRRLLEHLEPGPGDIFYDLGSGIGQVALHAALATRVARSVGIELSPTRHAQALTALERALVGGLERARACTLLNRDFLRTDLGDATLVYTCSTAFPLAVMKRLVAKLARGRSGLALATLAELEPSPWFELAATLRLDTSWRRRSAVYTYRLVRPRPR